uniref:putative sperm motility kinase W n=1 Tax=Arvicanthis niloticus TaxID=61156 RepID=UPI0014864361|nr:putative sperm motility kinase W [Arvicanthis niloticus]
MASNSTKENLRSQYRVLFYLGKGAFGTVNLASHLKTNALVAIKSVEITKKNISLILSERATWKTLSHPNIIRLFQVLITSTDVHFVMEYAPGGSLYGLIEENGPLREEEAKKIFGQIVAAVKYCHNLGIIHRDITPQNILRDAEGNVKLTDFGLAIKCRPGGLLKQKCGTKGFQAPELVLEEPYDGRKTDVWSLGVLLYFINTGYYPFTGTSMKELENKITMGTYKIPPNFSAQLENLIHQLFTISPEMRPSTEDIERHPWVRKCDINIPTDKYPDSNIIHMLCDMGFNANDILESLRKNKFDEKMGTYLLLKEQVRKGIEHTSTISAKPGDPCPTPPPSPAHISDSGLPLKRRASEPILGLLHIWPSGGQGPVALTPSGHKVARSVSMPPIALHCPTKKSSASTYALHSRAVAAPCVSSTTSEDEICLPPEQDFTVETPPPLKTGCFRRLGRRIWHCLSKLCCFPRAPTTNTQRHLSLKKVAPLKEGRCRNQ